MQSSARDATQEEVVNLIKQGHDIIDDIDNSLAGNRKDKLEVAIGYFRKALAKVSPPSLLWVNAKNGMGRVYIGLRLLDLAEKEFEEALAYCPQEASDWRAALRLNLGLVYRERGSQGNISKAIGYFQKALEQSDAVKDTATLAKINAELGNACFMLLNPDLSEVEKHYNKAAQLFDSGSRDHLQCIRSLAQVYHKMPNNRLDYLRKAAHLLEDALRISKLKEGTYIYADFSQSLANIYRDSVSLEKDIGLKGQWFQKADRAYQEALKVWTQEDVPSEYIKLQINIGMLYSNIQVGDYKKNMKEATKAFRNAIKVARKREFLYEWCRAHEEWGHLCKSTDKYGEAKKHYSKAIKGLSGLWKMAVIEEDYREWSKVVSGWYRDLGECHYRLGEYTEAVVAFESGKTRYLVELLTRHDASPRHARPEDQQAYVSLRDDIKNLEIQWRKESRLQREEAVIILEKLRKKRREYKNVSNRIHKDDPDFLPVAQPLTFDRIQALVPDKQTALVDIRILKDRALLFIITRHQLKKKYILTLPNCGWDAWFRPLGDRWVQTHNTLQELDMLDMHDSQHKKARWRDTIEETCAELYNQLLVKLDSRLRDLQIRRVVFLTHHALNLLPLHAAYREYKGEQVYLMDTYEISYCPSVLILERCLARLKSRQSTKTLLAVVNKKLELGKAEVDSLTRLSCWKKRLVSTDATISQVQEESKNAEFIHFSCHGAFKVAEPDNPFKMKLSLGREELTLSHVLGLDLQHARCVVLSACETGMTNYKDTADEYVGLPAGFLVAGAIAVIGSLWRVDDLATLLLMEKFYQNMLCNETSPPTALQQAQQWLRRLSAKGVAQHLKNLVDNGLYKDLAERYQLDSDQPPFAHPHFWAAFHVVGAGL